MCGEEQRATEEIGLVALGVREAYVWGFRVIGRSGSREEAGAGVGSFWVYTGGINRRQQKKRVCLHLPEALWIRA